MTTSYYDIVVVGTDLAGLVCSALAARRGYRVLIIGQNNISNNYSHEQFHFTKFPHIFYGFEASHWIRHVFVDLSIAQEMRHRPKHEDPSFQVLFPEHRLTAWADEQRYEAEFLREFPKEAARISEFFDRMQQTHRQIHPFFEQEVMIPPDGFRERREFKGAINRHPQLVGKAPWPDFFSYFAPDHPFRSHIVGPVLFMTHLHAKPLSPLQLVRNAFHLHSGLYHIEGGIDSLKSVFVQLVRNYCGDYKPHHVAGQMLIRRGRVIEVGIRNKSESIGCNMLVANCDPREVVRWIPDDQRLLRSFEPLSELRPRYYWYTVNFGVREAVIPEGLCPRSFYFPTPQAPFLNAEMMHVFVNKDYRGFDEQQNPLRAITVAVRVDAEEAHAEPLLGQQLRAAIGERLSRLIPFFDENLITTHSPWEQGGSESGRLDLERMIPV
ncbi:MAG: NAD(P)-binding protein, partial [Myxococcales bacterium]|nr:NAD(P)-binding protein [Myxococcales bacterium]